MRYTLNMLGPHLKQLNTKEELATFEVSDEEYMFAGIVTPPTPIPTPYPHPNSPKCIKFVRQVFFTLIEVIKMETTIC